MRHLVGRSAGCDLRLDDGRASREHAVLEWSGEGWRVRDLGSRNGTWLDGERVSNAGRDLRQGALLGFGDPEGVWEVVDDGPPLTFAEGPDGARAALEDGLLALPSVADPQAVIYEDEVDGWVIEQGAERAPLDDREVVTVAGVAWRLHLPARLASTISLSSGEPHIAALRLEFRVSLDEEHIELVAWHGSRAIDLQSRAHHAVLLTLARAHLEDQADPSLPVSARGWRYQDQVARAVGTEDNQIYVSVFRARKQFARAGIRGAARVVERRTGNRQLRLGVHEVEVRTI